MPTGFFHCVRFTIFNLTLTTRNVPLQACRMYILSCGVLISRPVGRKAVAMVTVGHIM
jgi:hypothetical protein